MAKNKKSVVIYTDLLYTIEKLDDENAGLFFKHFLRYVNDLNPESPNDLIDVLFESTKRQLKRDLVKYEKKLEQWSEAGKRSAEVRKANKKQRTLTNVKSRLTVSTVNDSVNDNVIGSNKKGFTTPTPKEVLQYMNDKGYPNQADRFCDFYSSKGWMIGKNKMKDWKSAVRNWNRKDTTTTTNDGYGSGTVSI